MLAAPALVILIDKSLKPLKVSLIPFQERAGIFFKLPKDLITSSNLFAVLAPNNRPGLDAEGCTVEVLRNSLKSARSLPKAPLKKF